jgi:nucleoside-diphosphate-sugar epimerase
MSHRLFITGAAGYVGAMLINELSKREDVHEILGLDREPVPEIIEGNQKLTYIQTNLEDDDWQEKAREFNPDIVIHTAWQIRLIYGKPEATWRGNIEGSDNVFKFAFATPSVKKLIHFSTVASYGAFETNTIEHHFKESEPFRKTQYMYAEEKRITEEHLHELYHKSDKHVQVAIVRPAAITGPRGRFMRIRFGLQSALSGQLTGSPIYSVIKAMVAFVPATKNWLRQFVHEDDVNDIVEKLAFENNNFSYEAFNLAPPGPVVRPKDMGQAVGKHVIILPPWLIRIVFFFFWHLTRGKVPTSKGSWKGYSYPIAVSGHKITDILGYNYKYHSLEAFSKTKGRYESFVPAEFRKD